MTVQPVQPQRSHEVTNQSVALEQYNAFDADPALQEALALSGGSWGVERARDFGALAGSAEALEHSRRALRHPPVLVTHDRFGHRLDWVDYDPSFHWLLRQGIERELAGLPWRDRRPGAHAVRAAMFLLMNALDTGPCCPVSMNYAAVPTLRQEPALAARWESDIIRPDYERYVQVGMAMTEKQGGSDLRQTTTRADPAGDGTYEVFGHKWFCTHPVARFFVALARAPGGLVCLLLERDPGFEIQRLKDKLGGRCLASSEVEFHGARAWPIGEEGRGIPTLIEQIAWTRLDTMLGVAGMMRRAVSEAIWHARHRHAFGARLVDQALMRNVLADLALESEAATWAAMRVVGAHEDDAEREFRRFAIPVMKYWICKRGAPVAAEALECLGGNGYIEEAPLAQVYRDIQVGSTWEGSGNVIALDVLRARRRSPDGLEAFLAECAAATDADPRLAAHLAMLRCELRALDEDGAEWQARRVAEGLALALQASLLIRHAPPETADAFCAARLGGGRRAFGTLAKGVDAQAILERALAL